MIRKSNSLAKLKIKKPIAYEFILDELARISPLVKPMFGSHAIYRGEEIVLIVREKDNHVEDNGIWIATTPEHHGSLQEDFPNMRSIVMFGPGPTGWQNLPADSDDFEESAYRVCKLVVNSDPRIGKIPASRKKKKLKKTPKAKKKLPKK